MNEQLDRVIDATAQRRFTTAEVQRLNEGARPALGAHFAALPADDRRLRFGAALSAESIAQCVARIDLGCDAVFGVFPDWRSAATA